MYKCEVLLTTDLLHKFDLFNMLSPSCKAPDHSLLSIEFTPFNMDRLLNVNTTMVENETKTSKCQSSKIYDFNRPKPDFMNNETWRNSILGIIESLQNRIASQEALDVLYNNICETLINEMDMYLEGKCINTKTKKFYKNSKPYWDNELSNMWKLMSQAEKRFHEM